MARGEKPTKPQKNSKNQKQSGVVLNLEERQKILKAQLAQKEMLNPSRSKHDTLGEADKKPAEGAAKAMKLSSEFLAGVVVGVVLGLGFDQLFNTSPWGLILFLFLGFAAGVLNILRSVGRVAPSHIGQVGMKEHALEVDDAKSQDKDI